MHTNQAQSEFHRRHDTLAHQNHRKEQVVKHGVVDMYEYNEEMQNPYLLAIAYQTVLEEPAMQDCLNLHNPEQFQ